MTPRSLLLSALVFLTLVCKACTPTCDNKLDVISEAFPVWLKKQQEDFSKITDYHFTTATSGRKLAETNSVLVFTWQTGDSEIRVKLQDRSSMQDFQVGQTCCFLDLVLRSYIEGVLTSYVLSQHSGQNFSALGETFINVDYQLGKIGNCSVAPVFEGPINPPGW